MLTLATPATAAALPRLADHLEAHVERGQREQALDRAAAAHDDEAAAVTRGPPLQREHAAEAGRVEEVERPQVEHDAARLRRLEAAHLLVEGVGTAEVELAAQRDADSVGSQALDGDPQRLIHAVRSFPGDDPAPPRAVSTPLNAQRTWRM